MELTGKVIHVLPKQEGVSKANGNPWELQTFIVETLDQYPRKVAFEIFGKDKIEQNAPTLDETVTVSFDLESRDYNGKWYTSARAWKVAKGEAEPAAKPMAVGHLGTAQETKAPIPVPTEQPAVEQLKAAVGGAEDQTQLPF